jgi:FAD:protein FMN transferase
VTFSRRTRSHSRQLAHASWQALGTTVVLRCADPAGSATARAIVECELAAIDRACSRFRRDSELSRLNAGGGRHVRASSLLIEALELAIAAARLTDGDVDPTVGRALELAGYDRDWSLLAPPPDELAPPKNELAPPPEQLAPPPEQLAPPPEQLAPPPEQLAPPPEQLAPPPEQLAPPPQQLVPPPRALAPPSGRVAPALTLRSRAGWRTIELDAASRIVRIPAGVRLDLGATAKAWAADRAAAAVHAASGRGVLVALGGDVATAGEPPTGGWRIRVTDDHRSPPSAPGQTIAIRSGGLATSSTAVRRWSHEGRTMHHIIDPGTAAPARTRWKTVSVAAGDCAQANIASTAAILRDDSAIAWLAALGLPARLQDRAGRVMTVGDWPSPGIDGAEGRELAVAR